MRIRVRVRGSEGGEVRVRILVLSPKTREYRITRTVNMLKWF